MKYAFLLLSFLIISCKPKLASFMPSHHETFNKTLHSKSIISEKEKSINVVECIDSLTITKISEQNNEFTEFHINDKITEKSNKKYNKKAIKIQQESKIIIEDQVKKKKRRKFFANPIFNDNVKIGIVFLVIAVVLSLFSLSQLALVFGLAALIFIYLGLKKYYRRKRIKQIFKK